MFNLHSVCFWQKGQLSTSYGSVIPSRGFEIHGLWGNLRLRCPVWAPGL